MNSSAPHRIIVEVTVAGPEQWQGILNNVERRWRRLAGIMLGWALLAGCTPFSAEGDTMMVTTAPPAPSQRREAHSMRPTLTVLHTNDIHGHLMPWRGWEGELEGKLLGGLDRLAAAIRQVRAEVGTERVLLLDVGDTLSDTLIGPATQGRAIPGVMNVLAYTAMTVGNHEPDFTTPVLRELIRQARFPVLAANLIDTECGEFFTRPYLIHEIAGLRLGILGFAYPNTALTTVQKNVAGLTFREAVSTANEFIPKMRRAGAELIIVLSHLGLGADQKLAERVAGIHVIVSGHSHNRMREALRMGETLIVQAGAHGSDLGRLDLMIDDGQIVGHSHTLIPLDHAAIPADPDIAHLIASLTALYRARLDERIGEAAVPIVRAQTLAGQKAEKRDAESPTDSLFADILRQETQSDITLLPGVGYGVAIPRGPITAADLRNLIPHDSKVVLMRLTGAEIRAILEQSVANVLTDDPDQKVGGMIQVSGLRFRYDPQAAFPHRVREISVGSAPLALDRVYQVATNSLLAEGCHNYRSFLAGRARQERGEQYQLIKGWISRQGPIETPPLGRIGIISHGHGAALAPRTAKGHRSRLMRQSSPSWFSGL